MAGVSTADQYDDQVIALPNKRGIVRIFLSGVDGSCMVSRVVTLAAQVNRYAETNGEDETGGIQRGHRRPPPLSGLFEQDTLSQPRSRAACISPCSPSKATAGYAWHRSLANEGGRMFEPVTAKQILWIDFIRLQPAVPVGALAAAKKAEREALLNVEVAHSTGYTDACSSINRLPASPIGHGVGGGRGASPGRRAGAAPHSTTSPMASSLSDSFNFKNATRSNAGSDASRSSSCPPYNVRMQPPAFSSSASPKQLSPCFTATSASLAGSGRWRSKDGTSWFQGGERPGKCWTPPAELGANIKGFTDRLRSWGYRPREHEGSLTKQPSLRSLSPLRRNSDMGGNERRISQWSPPQSSPRLIPHTLPTARSTSPPTAQPRHTPPSLRHLGFHST